MNLVRYEPWSLLDRFHNEVARAFDDTRVLRNGSKDLSKLATSGWSPAVDIKEEDNRYVLRADVPGVDPQDIEVTMDKGVLTIKGERVAHSDDKGEGYTRTERVYGTFYRQFSLPDTADAEGIAASGKNGVLEISIPKKENVQPRRISVN